MFFSLRECLLLHTNKLSLMIPYIQYVFMEMYFCIYTVDVSLYRLSMTGSHHVRSRVACLSLFSHCTTLYSLSSTKINLYV